MKISTRGRYALRLMLDIAVHSTDGERIPLRDIALRQEISEKYLEQIVPSLSKAGYVDSIRGARGGYRLKLPPEEITVGDILRTAEGGFAPVACAEECGGESCSRSEGCVATEVWTEVRLAVESVVDNITLAELVNRQRKKTEKI